MRRVASMIFVSLMLVVALSPRASNAADDTCEKRGCCSHHKGVCGCRGGSVVCCDGDLSPTCTC